MAGKFEWQFKYRDEGDVNACTRGYAKKCNKSLIHSHFCDSSDSVCGTGVRTMITIARSEARDDAPQSAVIVRLDGRSSTGRRSRLDRQAAVTWMARSSRTMMPNFEAC